MDNHRMQGWPNPPPRNRNRAPFTPSTDRSTTTAHGKIISYLSLWWAVRGGLCNERCFWPDALSLGAGGEGAVR